MNDLSDITAEVTSVSAEEPDWSREDCQRWWDPSRRLLKSIRDYERAKQRQKFICSIVTKWCMLRYKFWSTVCGAEIHLNSKIGGGLLIPHPNGIVIHPDVAVGPNCLIFQQVTIGSGGRKPGVPKIEGHVDIGAGAKILGGLVIGRHARIGANAVVLADVPAYSVAVGVPARVISSRAT